ncbi:MAG TPA: diguanylate cyclase [Spirochaetales bacterium]|nr:diguanylate cyclase [Spirochaetales bacterium]
MPVNRSIRSSVPFQFAAVTLFFTALVALLESLLVVRAFSSIELNGMRDRVAQFDAFLGRERESLANLAKSYAEWGDSYSFMSTRDPAYLENNYNADWIGSQGLDYVLIVDDDGRVVWDSGSSAPAFFPGSAGAWLYRSPLLFSPEYGSRPSASVRSLVELDGEPVLYASWPITDDLVTVAPRGVLVFARRLDPDALAEYVAGGEFSMGWRSARGSGTLPEPGPVKVSDGGRAYLRGAEPVRDAAGAIIGYWEFSQERNWIRTIRQMVAWFALIGAAGGLGIYAVLHRRVRRLIVVPLMAIKDRLGGFSRTLEALEPLPPFGYEELDELANHVYALTERVCSQTMELDRLASTDGLTGLPNRRSLEKTMDEFRRRRATGKLGVDCRSTSKRGTIAFGMIDVDFFKNYNDLYGHAGGDATLRAIGLVIRECVKRPDDLPSRYGGEEFAVILPDTDEEGAVAVLERVRQAIEALELPHAGSSAANVVTVSCGAAALRPDGPDGDLDQIMEMADKALYAAKAFGRNRVIAYSSLKPGAS